MAMQKPSTKTIGVRRIVKEIKSGIIDTNHKIQRRNVWKVDQKQGLVASILESYDIPAIYAIEDEEGKLSLLDGKQRITAAVEFVNGVYPLGEEFEDLDDEYFKQFDEGITLDQIKGKHFYDLPKDIQNEIETFTFNFRIYKKLTDKQISSLFYRLNRGTSLNNMELLRVDAEFMLDEITKLEQSKFFTDIVNMTDTAKNRFTDQEVIIQSLALLYYGGTGFNKKDLKNFVNEMREFKEQGLARYDEIINEMNYIITEYFNNAFTEKVKELRKIHIPTLVKVAVEATKREVEPERFGTWAVKFLQENTGRKSNSDYKRYTNGATTKEDSVTKRYEIMLTDFNENIDGIEKPEIENKQEENQNVENEPVEDNGFNMDNNDQEYAEAVV